MSESQPILLLTNDDGWDAPGLEALRLAAEGLGVCRIVAPLAPVSGCGHRVTTHAPIVISEPLAGCLAVDGTPADCVRLALHHLTPGVGWVFSGINAGGNLGADVHHSGTVAAVREAVLHGIPGIAVSHYIARGRTIDWSLAARWTTRVLTRLIEMRCEPGTFWNVNLPHLSADESDPEIVFCPLDPSPLPLEYQIGDGHATYAGNYQSRARKAHTDVDVCFGGRIAVSLIRAFNPVATSSVTAPSG